MNKSTLFTKAHTLTKKIIKATDSYRITFGACLHMLLTTLKVEVVNAQESNVKTVKFDREFKRRTTKKSEKLALRVNVEHASNLEVGDIVLHLMPNRKLSKIARKITGKGAEFEVNKNEFGYSQEPKTYVYFYYEEVSASDYL